MALNVRSQLIPIPPLHDPTITFEQTDGAIGSIFGHSGYRSYLTRKITGRRDREETSHNHSCYDPIYHRLSLRVTLPHFLGNFTIVNLFRRFAL
ncbi:MAG TPA: hypothetical protein VK626_03695, partial [Nitrospiraceae bacterium]|nr:hypothetical protein [Nitrospiraceae bacterium]